MIRTEGKNLNWAHYKLLDNDVDGLSRYIDFSQENFSTYSIQLAHLLLAIGSEIDILLKQFCGIISDSSNVRNITQYKDIILSKVPELVNYRMESYKYGLILEPWRSWKDNVNPKWWTSYNKVKHERNNYFYRANLGNTLEALAGLFIVNLLYSHELRKLSMNFPLDLRETVLAFKNENVLFKIADPLLYIED